MADEEDEVHVATGSNPIQPHYLEIICKSSGKIRRFAVGTKAGFALQLINRKLSSGKAVAAYIEADKEGEEPIIFGPTAVLENFGDGWTLQTVLDEVTNDQVRNKLFRSDSSVKKGGWKRRNRFLPFHYNLIKNKKKNKKPHSGISIEIPINEIRVRDSQLKEKGEEQLIITNSIY
ncbi:hypothetical protein ACHQM5_019473 [Ranunculus cassubicifolius]